MVINSTSFEYLNAKYSKYLTISEEECVRHWWKRRCFCRKEASILEIVSNTSVSMISLPGHSVALGGDEIFSLLFWHRWVLMGYRFLPRNTRHRHRWRVLRLLIKLRFKMNLLPEDQVSVLWNRSPYLWGRFSSQQLDLVRRPCLSFWNINILVQRDCSVERKVYTEEADVLIIHRLGPKLDVFRLGITKVLQLVHLPLSTGEQSNQLVVLVVHPSGLRFWSFLWVYYTSHDRPDAVSYCRKHRFQDINERKSSACIPEARRCRFVRFIGDSVLCNCIPETAPRFSC